MKTTRYALTVLLAVAAVAGVRAADAKAAPRTEVIFSHPEKFSDASDGPRGTDLRRDVNLGEIRDYLVDRAQRFVPAGDKLTVTITDVDLAGEVEPWHARAQDVRIIRDTYPPRIDLEFRLTDASGAVVKEGKRHLTDLNYTMNLNPFPNDPRVYEKRLIDDWLHNEFRKIQK